MAYISEISRKHKFAIDELRERMKDDLQLMPDYDNDMCLLRWLIGWDYNIDIIVPKFHHAISTIKALNLDQLDLTSVEKIDKYTTELNPNVGHYYPGGIVGFDKEGNVIKIEPIGRADPKSLLCARRMSEALIGLLAESQGALTLIRENEKRLNKKLGVVILMDMEGFSLDMLQHIQAIKIFNYGLQLLQDLFPDVARKVYIINASGPIQVGYNMVSRVLSKQTKEKIEFLGSDWRDRLRQVIEPEQLFPQWGGCKRHPAVHGWVRMGGKVPKHLQYSPKKNPEEPTSKDLNSLVVPSRGSQKIYIKVDQTDTLIKWFFQSKDGDVYFSIQNNSQCIWPRLCLDTKYVPEWGQVLCKEPGDYVITFDNSHSKLWSKEVKYRIVAWFCGEKKFHSV